MWHLTVEQGPQPWHHGGRRLSCPAGQKGRVWGSAVDAISEINTSCVSWGSYICILSGMGQGVGKSEDGDSLTPRKWCFIGFHLPVRHVYSCACTKYYTSKQKPARLGTPPSSRMHILHNRPRVRPQNKSWYVRKIEITQSTSSNHSGMELNIK